ncbi:unnamed protein product [Didymodactylos carnosus]|uniref:BHLH domain-containing protein n=1 Tax=Didymodactylos carnosus TaxID=1234261 RepID=A0A814NT95_9BILA|nr:unnamed protein product [Didymodactylos carnosus]CAF1098060.1 unnamed protein product [Didymodactylos carnosus]CAF3836177.1 unnamed protein product [Didymodactylos carnosus]CAF3863118.1 unnamed protein product [Didymodactylos carnosus]
MSSYSNSSSSESSTNGGITRPNRGGRKQIKTGTSKRNARERNRVRHINTCFDILRQHIPHERANKKLSKVDTLKSAMNYIEDLQRLLGKDTMLIRTHHDFENEEDDNYRYLPIPTNDFCMNYRMNECLRQQFQNGKENQMEETYTIDQHRQDQQSLNMMTLMNTTKHEVWDWGDSSTSQ